MLIGSTLALLLLLLIHSLLVPVLDTGARTTLRTQLRQQATLALRHLSADLRQTRPEALEYLPGPPLVLALRPVTGLTSSGRPLFATDLVVYVWRDGAVIRASHRPEPPLEPETLRPLTQAQLRALADQVQGRVLARGVTAFDPLGGWPPGQPPTASLRLEAEQRGVDDSLTVTRAVGFRT